MEKIKGTVTLDLEVFDRIRQQAENYNPNAKEEAKQEFRKEIMKLIAGFDDEEYIKRLKLIDDTDADASDSKISKMFDESLSTLRIIVNERQLKRMIRKYIDQAASDTHEDIKKASDSVLERIQIVLKKEDEK